MLRFPRFVLLHGLLVLLPSSDGRVAHADQLHRFERSERHMGTQFTITLYASTERQANKAFEAAFGRFAQLDRIFSNYRADSEVSRLSASGPHAVPVRVSEDAWRVIWRAQQISRMTDGAFDITLGPLTRLWRRARLQQQLPDALRLAEARQRSGFTGLRIVDSTRSIQLTRTGMKLDFGGIAKGDALDQAMIELKRQGVSRALIDGGGDVLAGDPPPGTSGWRVGLVGLHDGRVTESIPLANRAAATSGDLTQFVEIGDVRYSHIIDPKTGLGLTRRSTVTVTACEAIDADAFASAISVLGPARGMRFVASHEGVEARMVFDAEGRLTEVTSQRFGTSGPSAATDERLPQAGCGAAACVTR